MSATRAYWDGLDFAALQTLMVDRRWNGQPGAQMDSQGRVSILMSGPGNPAGLYREIQPGTIVEIGADNLIYLHDVSGEALP